MSRMLDALRRGGRDRDPPQSTRDGEESQADTVLAALGYSDDSRRLRQRRRTLILAGAIAVVVFGAGAVALVNWFPLPADAVATTPGRPIDQPVGPDPLRDGGRSNPPQTESSNTAASPNDAARDRIQPEGPLTALPRRENVRSTDPVSVTAIDPVPDRVGDLPRVVAGSRGSDSPRPAPIPTAPAATAVTTETDHFKLAVYHQRAGDLDTALFHYRALLERNELNAEAHNNLGLVYQQKGLREDAIREFQRAILIEPTYAKAHNNFGVVLLQMGNADAAAKEFQSVLATDPKDVDAMINLALALKALGQAGKAQETLLQALAHVCGRRS
jgi:tetratricopeptide (TPR) repeat protein